MGKVWILDADILITLARAGLFKYPSSSGSFDPRAFSFFNDIIDGNERIIVNSKVIEEAENLNYEDGILIDDWLENNLSSGRIERPILLE